MISQSKFPTGTPAWRRRSVTMWMGCGGSPCASQFKPYVRMYEPMAILTIVLKRPEKNPDPPLSETVSK
jgi:hypothetical protein